MVICGHKADRKKTFWESTELRNDFEHDFPNQAYLNFTNLKLKKNATVLKTMVLNAMKNVC